MATRPEIEELEVKVLRIVATKGAKTLIEVKERESGQIRNLYSSRVLIQFVLFEPLMFETEWVVVEVDTTSKEVHRVHMFMYNQFPKAKPAGDYNLRRIATQRAPNGDDEHLEVEVERNGEMKAYNVYDLSIQHVLTAIFGYISDTSGYLYFDLTIDETEITSVVFPGRK